MEIQVWNNGSLEPSVRGGRGGERERERDTRPTPRKRGCSHCLELFYTHAVVVRAADPALPAEGAPFDYILGILCHITALQYYSYYGYSGPPQF